MSFEVFVIVVKHLPCNCFQICRKSKLYRFTFVMIALFIWVVTQNENVIICTVRTLNLTQVFLVIPWYLGLILDVLCCLINLTLVSFNLEIVFSLRLALCVVGD